MEGRSEKVLIVTGAAKDDLEKEYRYYESNYSVEAAERLRKGFNSELLKIIPNPYVYPECRFLPTKTQLYRNSI